MISLVLTKAGQTVFRAQFLAQSHAENWLAEQRTLSTWDPECTAAIVDEPDAPVQPEPAPSVAGNSAADAPVAAPEEPTAPA